MSKAMDRVSGAVIAAMLGLALSGCTGVLDRCAKGLDPSPYGTARPDRN